MFHNFFLIIKKDFKKSCRNLFLLSFLLNGCGNSSSSIEIATTQDFNEKLLSISRSSNNWLSISIPSGSVDTTSFNSIHFFNPIVDIKTVQMDNILQLSFLLSIIPDDFDIYTESKKIIIRLDTAQRSNAEKIRQDKKKYIFDTVIIDPGHGGKDPGAIANGFREKDITLSIAHKIGDKLEKILGVNVIYTREEDVFLSLKSRTEIANTNNGDVFLSIHANSINNSPSTKGFETYLLRPGKTKDAIKTFKILITIIYHHVLFLLRIQILQRSKLV